MSLWKHRAFMRLWAAQTVSVTGSQVTGIALPLTAVLTLEASAAQLGLLVGAGMLPNLLVAPFAGVVVDRLDRRRLMVASDLARALLLGLIPVAWMLGWLSLPLLILVAFGNRALTLVFDLAAHAFLPGLVERRNLTDANSKLQTTQSSALALGPALGGVLVDLLTAPVAIAVDAGSFLLSGALLTRVRARGVSAPSKPVALRIRAEVMEGLRFVWRNGLLRAIALIVAGWNLFGNALQALFVLYVARDLGVSPVVLGLIVGVGSIGHLASAVLAPRIAAWIGRGMTMRLALFSSACGWLVIALAGGPYVAVVAMLTAGRVLASVGSMLFDINALTTRQIVTPDAMLGRVFASSRFIGGSLAPLGALLGGLAGSALGTRETIALAAGGLLAIAVVGWFSPLRREDPDTVATRLGPVGAARTTP